MRMDSPRNPLTNLNFCIQEEQLLQDEIMKWTVLTDNRTNDPTLATEHGLSILLETDRHSILLDTGATDVFIQNARTLGVDLSKIDYVFISHGHSDHAGGLRHLMSVNDRAKVIVSPRALSGRFFSKRLSLHSITAEWPEIPAERLLAIDQSAEIADGLFVIANIPQVHPVPKGNRHLFMEDHLGECVHDDFRHELALYADGLLFTGCAHSGLENILSACPYPIKTVVGGFHLLDHHETEEKLKDLAARLMEKYPDTTFYTSHCTGDQVFPTLHGVMADHLHAFSCGTQVEDEALKPTSQPTTPAGDNVQICAATRAQAAEIAQLIMMAMTDDCCLHFCGVGYGLKDFQKMMTALVERENSQYSYRNTLVAMADKKVVGIAVSYDGGQLHELRRAFIQAAKTCIGKDHSGMDDETQAGELYLDSLAVWSAYRRRGIAQCLLRATKEKADRMGLPCVGLLVDQGNPAGEALYASVGFRYANDSHWGGHPMRHLVL